MTDARPLVATLAAVVVAGVAPVVTMTIYLGGRLDRIADRLGAVEVEQARTDERMTAGFARVEGALADHAATHARLAHGRPQS